MSRKNNSSVAPPIWLHLHIVMCHWIVPTSMIAVTILLGAIDLVYSLRLNQPAPVQFLVSVLGLLGTLEILILVGSAIWEFKFVFDVCARCKDPRRYYADIDEPHHVKGLAQSLVPVDDAPQRSPIPEEQSRVARHDDQGSPQRSIISELQEDSRPDPLPRLSEIPRILLPGNQEIPVQSHEGPVQHSGKDNHGFGLARRDGPQRVFQEGRLRPPDNGSSRWRNM